ncbi:MAG TPA: hypothetical protein PKC60_01465 [Hydrogenophaga sp.]|uniref:hypothetical protein n=1 Tax=Hydrogenophaga sp. TaxID=1904254 RepID=UPI002BE2CEF7|nr:hypothetical protein [Hydrogenophaga sp.]HMN91875.1 hypothetical protein [Hydrogenophaga sp.]HMP08985.1 hypothetical protein [Hydrogenophaga sp.]
MSVYSVWTGEANACQASDDTTTKAAQLLIRRRLSLQIAQVNRSFARNCLIRLDFFADMKGVLVIFCSASQSKDVPIAATSQQKTRKETHAA